MHEQIVFKNPACFCQKLCADQVILQDYEIVRLGVIMLIIHLHLHLNISEYFYVLLSSFYCTWIMVPPVQCSVQRSHFTCFLTCFTVISGRKWKSLKTWNFYELTVQNTLIYSAFHKVHFTTWLENVIVFKKVFRIHSAASNTVAVHLQLDIVSGYEMQWAPAFCDFLHSVRAK